jgi:hypothetical protein
VDPTWFKAVEEYGLALIIAGVLAVFYYRLDREHHAVLKERGDDARKERDEALAGWRGATSAIERWSDLEEQRHK